MRFFTLYRCIIMVVVVLTIYLDDVTSMKLRPGGKNVCKKTFWYDGYAMKVSSYVGYENYLTCCGAFCWKKCQKSRPVRKTYMKNVKERRLQTTYECCQGYAPHNGECTIPVCKPQCQHGVCNKPNQCSCYKGYNGKQCSNEINECQQQPAVCDQLCTNLLGSYACSCRRGFQKVIPTNPTHRKCKNVNECSVSKSLCQCSNPSSTCVATCHDTIGSYRCTCSKGYKLSGKNLCVDQNECITNTHGCQHYCYNNQGRYSCGCKNGFVLNVKDKKTCVDINECLHANGGCEQLCRNSNGAYSCACRQGFKLSQDKRSCVDINECSTLKPCDPTLGICHNTRGSYTCSCKPGYKLDKNKVLCIDLDECLTAHHGCQHKCSNLIGSYHCLCPIGYKLAYDHRTCEEINECQVGTHRCQHICMNTAGSYTCKCRQGYALNTDGRSCHSKACTQLPEISNGKLNCPSTSLGAVCSYTCQDGYQLHGNKERKCLEAQVWGGNPASCQPLSCPDPYPPQNGQLSQPCIQKFGSRCVIACNHGYHLEGSGFLECSKQKGVTRWNLLENTCKVIELCKPNPCMNQGKCYMLSHSDYKCDCKDTGYIGERCSTGIIQLPSFPTLDVEKMSDTLIINAKPANELTIIPKVPNNALVFHPSRLTIKFPNTQVPFNIESKSIVGRVRIEFELQGPDSATYYEPASTVIRVSAKNHVPLKRSISQDIFIRQCSPSQQIGKCPNSAAIKLFSSCSWQFGRTEGHVSVGTDQHRVPFSIAGYDQIQATMKNGKAVNSILTPRSSVGELNGKRSPICTSSGHCPNQLSDNEYEFSVKNNHFIKAYLKQLSKLSPWWFQLMVNPSYEGFDVNNFQSLVYRGKLPEDIPTCGNLPKLSRSGLYSVFAMKTNIDVNFMSSRHTTRDFGAWCIILDLCNNVYYMSLPSKQSIDTTARTTSANFATTYFSISGLSLSTGESVVSKCMSIYDGENVKQQCVDGNVWMKFTVNKARKMFNLTFDGEVTMKVDDIQNFGISRLDEARTVIGEGDIYFSINIPLAGGNIRLNIADKTCQVFKEASQGSFDNDNMTIVTSPENIRFFYNTPTITYTPMEAPTARPFQLQLNYSLRGGSVKSVSNSLKIRSVLTYIYRTLDRIRTMLVSKNINYFAIPYMQELSKNISQYTRQLLSTVDYKNAVQNYQHYQNKFNTLKEMFGDLKIKIQKTLPSDRTIVGRIRSLESRLFGEDLIPSPETTAITENLHGFEMSYSGGFCIHKLCFKSCLFIGTFSKKDSSKQHVRCIMLEDQTLRKDVRITKGSIISADISTMADRGFRIWFSASFSFHHQIVSGTVDVNTKMALFKFQQFEICKDFKFNVVGEASVTSLSTWESLSFSYSGESGAGSNHLGMFQQRLVKYLEQNAYEVSKKIIYYDHLYNTTKKTVKEFEIVRTKNNARLLEIREATKLADGVYRHSNAAFNNAKEQFKSYQVTSYLKDYQRQLDNVCKLSNCPQTCLGTQLCKVCQRPEIVQANMLKCENIKRKVRVTQKEQFEDACNEAVNVYKNVYTGTCRTGGDVSGLRNSLPNWGSGIGELIGGPTGAIIGALSGVVVGQFFESCTDTWKNYLVKEVATVPCTKTRFLTKEEEWVESKCNSFKQKVISEFGVPTSCNCSSQCVMTQEPSCLKNNDECRARRANRLKSMLQTARVFNDSAMTFMSAEKDLEVAAKNVISSRLELREAELRYNQSLNDYSQAITYIKTVHANLEKASNNDNIDFCLKDKWGKLNSTGMLQINAQSFGPVSYIRKELKTILKMKIGANTERSVDLLLNTNDIESSFENAMKEITSKLLCDHIAMDAKQMQSPLLFSSNAQYSQADTMCNRVLELYGFIRYPITALFKLESGLRSKRNQMHTEISTTITKLNKLKREGATLDITKVDIRQTENRLRQLRDSIERYSEKSLMRIWRNDMEKFADKTNIMLGRGVVEAFNYIESEIKSVVKYSGVSRSAVLSKLIQIKSGYKVIYFQEHTIKNLKAVIIAQQGLIEDLFKLTKFCGQYLSVSIDKPHQVNVLSGDMVTLNCLTKKNQTKAKYTWYHNQEPLQWEHQSKLVFQSRDSATYRCMVETATLSNVSSEIYVHVESRPVLLETLANITIIKSEEKNRFTLLCNTSANPLPKIKWNFQAFASQKNEELLFGEEKQVLEVSKKSVRPGFYSCTATNKHGSIKSNKAKIDVLGACVAKQAFQLSFTVPRKEVTMILDKIFYSDDAKKAWSVATTQRVTLAIIHHNTKSKVHFKLVDELVSQTGNRCRYNDRTMVGMVATSKTNMVQLLRNVLRTMSVQTNENVTIAELREELRSTLLLEPYPQEFCPSGYILHESQYKCMQCPAGTYEENQKCKQCLTGHYQPRAGSSGCVKCALGKSTTKTGSTSLFHCII